MDTIIRQETRSIRCPQVGSCTQSVHTMHIPEWCQQGKLGHLVQYNQHICLWGLLVTYSRPGMSNVCPAYYVIIIFHGGTGYIHSCRLLQVTGLRSPRRHLCGPPPLCHDRHHGHILLIAWSALRAILVSRFIRATMHAELWFHTIFLFSFPLSFPYFPSL